MLAIFASGLIGDEALTRAQQAQVHKYGPEWAGLILGVLLVVGARSGSRGGPLALEAADVHNLLLAPLPRGRVLRRPSIGSIGYGSSAGAAVGALAGLLFAQRIPGGNAAFIASGVLFGATAAAAGFGFAFLAASRRIPAVVMVVIALILTGLSIANLTDVIAWAPLSEIGTIPFWPLGFAPASLIGVLIVIGCAVAGVSWIGGLSIESAQRRTRLVGQLRFAVTQQDLRSVLLLRRQLASELPGSRNRLRFLSRPLGPKFPIVGRGLASIGRWPRVRIIRVGVLCVGAGFASRAVWLGTTPMILVAGLCTYVAALDAIEPLAQEIDHPLLVDSYPHERGDLFQRHLIVPVLVLLTGLVLSAAVVLALGAPVDADIVAAITVVTASLAGVAGAAVSVVGEAVLSALDEAMMPPEVAGPRVVFRMLWPPLVAISGFIPVIAAQRAMRDGSEIFNTALTFSAIPLVISVGVFAWVRYRDELHDSMNEAMGR